LGILRILGFFRDDEVFDFTPTPCRHPAAVPLWQGDKKIGAVVSDHGEAAKIGKHSICHSERSVSMFRISKKNIRIRSQSAFNFGIIAKPI
jgi:hypothetical protein